MSNAPTKKIDPAEAQRAMNWIRAVIRPGAVLTIISNEMHPWMNGQTRTVVKAAVGRADVLGPKGNAAHIILPTMPIADRVIRHSDDEVSWRMGTDRESQGCDIRYRVQAPTAPARKGRR